ncbi:MAG: ABC transporter permease, partial [Chitinophagaceae bacterium]|nr:ABC transporter permease [Chitinophagaceae bacterium]
MLRNYLKIAWRNLIKHKLFSLINIFGLALSLSVCMMVMVQVKDDLSYDLFHPFPDRTYRILSDIVENKNNKQYKLASTPLPLKNELFQKTDIIEAAVEIYPALKGKAGFGDKELHINGAFTDTSFFEIFGFKLSSGNKKEALKLTNGIVLSSETAFRFFGTTNPIGKILSFGKMGLFQVTGVLEKSPGKSHITFDAFASLSAVAQLEKSKVLPERQNNWNSMNDAYTYALLKSNISSKHLDQVLKQISMKSELKSEDGKINFISQPLSKITPGTDGIYNEIGKGTVWAKLLTVTGVGFIILLAACFNYTNLTVARALTRAKEVGIRKVSGAKRYQIFLQYIVEAVLIALLALAFACLGLAQFKPDLHFNFQLLISVTLFTILTGTLAGAFPAWILSAFKPVNVLKSISTQKLFGNLSLQKGLMIFQFSLSLLVIIFLSAYYRQFSFLETLDPGFYSKNILTIPLSGKDKILANEISRIGGVERISGTSENFGMRGSGTIPVFLNKPADAQGILCDMYFTDEGIVPLHRLKLVAGLNFPDNEEFFKEKYILINEKATEVFGFKNPVSAIGKTVWLNDSTEVEIKGIVKDFYDKGVARRITPLLLRNRYDAFNYLNIQVNAADKEHVVKQISSVWNKLNPHTPFEYQWLDKKIAEREDQSDAYSTMSFLAFITISIASLGLLGLVVYTVETRQKEISIRKVMGASINQLMFLLSKGFLKLLLIAGLIAMPIGYVASFFFLQNFANRVPFGLDTLLLCFLFLIIIGMITILSNTY